MSNLKQHENREKEYENELIGVEATILFLKESIKWLKSLIDTREGIRDTQTGHHYPIVENVLIKTATETLELLEAELKKAIEEYGEYPYLEYMDKKLERLGIEVEA